MFPFHLNMGFRIAYFYEGFYFLIAMVAAYIWAKKRIQKATVNGLHGIDDDSFHAMLGGVIVGAIVGARISHFLFWDYKVFLSDPLVLLRVWEGGLSIVGGLAGGIFGAWFVLYRKGKDFFSYFAILAPTIALGQAVGRVGCFLNGDAFGAPTSLPWGVRFPRYGMVIPGGETPQLSSSAWTYSYESGLVDASSLSSVPLHPTQLYESLGDIGILLLLVLVFSYTGIGTRRRAAFFVHGGLYSLLRFGMEFIRADREVPLYFGMTGLQWVLGILALVFICFALIELLGPGSAKVLEAVKTPKANASTTKSKQKKPRN